MGSADEHEFSVDDVVNEPLSTGAPQELRAVLGFPAPVGVPRTRPLRADRAAEKVSEVADGPPQEQLEEMLRELTHGLARVADRLALLEVRGTDPSGLLEEIDRKLEKLLDSRRAASATNHSTSELQLDLSDVRLELQELRATVDRVANHLFG
jgi:hypothetical protein